MWTFHFLLMMVGCARYYYHKWAKIETGYKVVLLPDGTEVHAVFGLQLNFDDIMAGKRQHFDQRSGPYHRVVVGIEAARVGGPKLRKNPSNQHFQPTSPLRLLGDGQRQ